MNLSKVKCLLAVVAATVVSFAAFAENLARYSLDGGATWTEVGAMINAFDAVKAQSSDAIIEALADGTIMPWGNMKDAQCNIVLRSSTAGDDVYTLNRGSSWDGWYVSSGKTLTISNIVLDGGSQQGRDLLVVENGGTLRLGTGAVITSSHTGDVAGSAVKVSGDLYFEGGVVKGWRESSVPPVQIADKGTVYIHAGGIEDCTQTSVNVGMPSAIGGCNISYFEDDASKIQRTVLYMTGGFIRNNAHTGVGTAVRGAISFNRAPIIEISGGEISGNVGADEYSCGVFMGNADWGREGVARISGNPIITGNTTASGASYNVQVEKSSRFVQIGDLTSGANIGVYSTGNYTENATFGMLSAAGFTGADLIYNDRDATLVGSANGTKLTWVVGSVVLDPEIGAVSAVVNSTVATIGLEGVKMGTDDEAVPATSYSVSYSLDGGAAQKALENQTGETASFDIAGLTEGDHSCSVTITSDKGKTSAAKAVAFTVKIEIVDPSIGSVTAQPIGSTAIVTLADIVRGTDAAGDPATMYSVYYKLNGGENVLALENQTAASVDFAIEDLEDGDYTCAVWIVTDKEKTSEAKSVNFKINSKLGDFDKLKADVEAAAMGATVVVPPGFYQATGTINVSQKNVTVIAVGNVVINGEEADGAIFDVKAEGVTITGVEFECCTNAAGYGGAINVNNNYHGFVAMNCIFRNCAAKMGGGIGGSYFYGSHGAESPDGIPARGELGIITGCTFIDCASTGTSGGDGESGGGAVAGAFWIEDSTFEGGTSNFYSPGIYSRFNTMVTNCTFKKVAPAGNNSTRGQIYIARNDTELQVIDCTFADTTCQPLVGTASNKLLVDRCVFENCAGAETKPDDISGDMTLTYGKGTVRNSLFCKNMNPFRTGNLVFENCTIVDNIGGLFVRYNSGNPAPAFTNCVWARNTKWAGNGYTSCGGPGLSWHGGDVEAYKRMTFSHCAIEGASTNEKLGVLFGQDSTGKTKTLTEALDEKGPKFTDPENGDYTLKSGSPLQNVGVFCDWMTGAKDLAGNPRAKDGKVDLGCYERKATGMLVILR